MEVFMTEKYEVLIDELNYEIERVLDKYRATDRSVPICSVIGLFLANAIELALEQQGITYHQLRELINLNGL